MENLEIFRNEFKKVKQSKICLKENLVMQFEPKKKEIFLKLCTLSWQGT